MQHLMLMLLSPSLWRRHLTPSQKAMLALALDAYQRERAAARERVGGRPPKDKPRAALPAVSGKSPEERRPRHSAGKVAGVSGRLVQDALKVTQASPELAEQVRSGKLTVTAAARQIQRAEERRRAAATPPVHEHVAPRPTTGAPTARYSRSTPTGPPPNACGP